MATNLQLGSAEETDLNTNDQENNNVAGSTTSIPREINENSDVSSEDDSRSEAREEVNADPSVLETVLSIGSTIYNPRESSENSNDFPGVNSSEPQNEKSYVDIAAEGFREIVGLGIKNDTILRELLQHYSNGFKDKQQQKVKLKRSFFLWIMILLSIVTLGCFALPVLAIIFEKDMATVIVSASASVVEFSIAFLKLPHIVAEYLFDKEEDKAMAKFVSDTQEYTIKRTTNRF